MKDVDPSPALTPESDTDGLEDNSVSETDEATEEVPDEQDMVHVEQQKPLQWDDSPDETEVKDEGEALEVEETYDCELMADGNVEHCVKTTETIEPSDG